MTLVWEEGACKGAEELSVGVGKQLSKERRCNEGVSSPQQPGLKVFKNSRVMRCPKHQSWALGNSEHLSRAVDAQHFFFFCPARQNHHLGPDIGLEESCCRGSVWDCLWCWLSAGTLLLQAGSFAVDSPVG